MTRTKHPEIALSKIALFDMDRSLADYDGGLLEGLRKLKKPREKIPSDFWAAERRFPWFAARMRAVKKQPGFWENLKPIPNGMKVFWAAQQMGFDNMVLSKASRGNSESWTEKHKWCIRELGAAVPVTLSDRKWLVDGDMMYDDFPEYVDKWLERHPDGLVIMPVTRENRKYKHPRVVKWDGSNWKEVRACMKACLKRKPGQPLILPHI